MINFLIRLVAQLTDRRRREVLRDQPLENTHVVIRDRVFKGPHWYREVQTFDRIEPDLLDAGLVEGSVKHEIRCWVHSASSDGKPGCGFHILGESIMDATSVAGVVAIIEVRLAAMVDEWGLPAGIYRAEMFSPYRRWASVVVPVIARSSGRVDPLRN